MNLYLVFTKIVLEKWGRGPSLAILGRPRIDRLDIRYDILS